MTNTAAVIVRILNYCWPHVVIVFYLNFIPLTQYNTDFTEKIIFNMRVKIKNLTTI